MSAWERTKKIARWSLLNGIWYAMGMLGAVAGLGWAWNVFVFITVVLVLAYGLVLGCMFIAASVYKPIKLKYDLAFPIWVDAVTDSIMMLVVAAFGHWFVAFLVLVQLLTYALLIHGIKPDEATTPA